MELRIHNLFREVSAYRAMHQHTLSVPGADGLLQVVLPVLDEQMPEGLPQHLDNKCPGVDAARIHGAQQQNEHKGGGEEQRAVDAHGDNSQDASSDTHKQVPAQVNNNKLQLFTMHRFL